MLLPFQRAVKAEYRFATRAQRKKTPRIESICTRAVTDVPMLCVQLLECFLSNHTNRAFYRIIEMFWLPHVSVESAVHTVIFSFKACIQKCI